MQATLIRRALLADALLSSAAGIVMIVGGAALAPLLNLPAELLDRTRQSHLTRWRAGGDRPERGVGDRLDCAALRAGAIAVRLCLRHRPSHRIRRPRRAAIYRPEARASSRVNHTRGGRPPTLVARLRSPVQALVIGSREWCARGHIVHPNHPLDSSWIQESPLRFGELGFYVTSGRLQFCHSHRYRDDGERGVAACDPCG